MRDDSLHAACIKPCRSYCTCRVTNALLSYLPVDLFFWVGELQIIHAATVKDCSALHAAPKERMLESTDQPETCLYISSEIVT